MRKRMMAFLLIAAMVLTSVLQPMSVQAENDSDKNYTVIKPAGYDDEHSYPVVYVLPQNGYDQDDSGIAEKLQAAMGNGTATKMLIVKPEFKEGEDLHAAMDAIIAAVDENYNTIKDAEHRAVVGTGVGGYLAYILGLTENAAVVDEEQPAPPVADVAVEEEAPADAAVEEEAPADVAVEEEAPADVAVEEEAPADAAVEEEAPAAEAVEEVAPAAEAVEEEVAPVTETEAVVVAAEAEEKSATPTIEVKTLTAPKNFRYIASTRGDFVSKDNVWYETYGDVYEYMKAIGAGNLANFYTYIDSPVDDAWADMEGSTHDIGRMIINNGTSEDACEFTTRPGEFTEEFLTESANRIARRITDGVLGDVISGTVSLKSTILSPTASTFDVNYTVNTTDAISKFTSATESMEIVIDVLDPSTGEVLASNSATTEVGEPATGTLVLDKNVKGTSATVVLTVKVLGTEFELATANALVASETVVDGDYQHIDLMGDWYFNYVYRGMTGTGPKGYEAVKEAIESGSYTTEWSVVQPGLDWWNEGFGNVKKEVMYGYDAYFGEGWYVRTFDVPSDFDAEELVLSVGNLDDRGQVFVNGVLVGETGMNNGVSNNETTWEVYSYFDIDPSVLNIGGTNTMVVRCYNDGFGGGGWYAGPIGLYSKSAFESGDSATSYFVEEFFDSKYAASAQGKEGTVQNAYLIYLPESYNENPDRYYPTVYLMHQYNSTHKSYITDSVDVLLRNAAKEGILDEMIVVVPNSQENSWWRGDWMKMVSEELVPLIDSKYRTIDDARYRFTAGCSMGGQGAFGVALQNPDLFSGAISFFGAFSMGEDASPNTIVEQESVEYMDNFAMYFICGNQDGYKFGDCATELHQQLYAKGIDHEFFIENGEHDSPFYVPHFIDAFKYVRDNMYKSNASVYDYLIGDAVLSETSGKVEVTVEALAGIENYFNYIPDSSYTPEETPALSIPVIVELEQNGKVFRATGEVSISEGELTDVVELDLPEGFDPAADYTVTLKAAVFDMVDNLKKEADNDEPGTGETPDEPTVPGEDKDPDADKPADTDKDDADKDADDKESTDVVKTGDDTPIMMYVVVAAMALVVAVIAVKRRKA